MEIFWNALKRHRMWSSLCTKRKEAWDPNLFEEIIIKHTFLSSEITILLGTLPLERGNLLMHVQLLRTWKSIFYTLLYNWFVAYHLHKNPRRYHCLPSGNDKIERHVFNNSSQIHSIKAPWFCLQYGGHASYLECKK